VSGSRLCVERGLRYHFRLWGSPRVQAPAAVFLHGFAGSSRDWERFGEARRRANLLPLGSGALAGSGFPFDREAIPHIDESQLWIYVGSQASLAKLIAMETEESVRAQYRAGLAVNARNARPAIHTHTSFDNEDTKVFGNANWRALYSTWFPQASQADAKKLSEIADNTKRGERKGYESRWMKNPLAAAAIVALTGDGAEREAIEQAIRHYDYARLNMAEFFFAECAFYALPDGK